MGIYYHTAKDIKKRYGVEVTRQSVRDRANRHPEELNDILAQTIDVAEKSLLDLITQDKDKRIKLEAAKTYLRAKARHKGWGEKHELLVRQMTVLSTEERTDRRLALEEKMKANKRIDI